jgi:hypothetical protein
MHLSRILLQHPKSGVVLTSLDLCTVNENLSLKVLFSFQIFELSFFRLVPIFSIYINVLMAITRSPSKSFHSTSVLIRPGFFDSFSLFSIRIRFLIVSIPSFSSISLSFLIRSKQVYSYVHILFLRSILHSFLILSFHHSLFLPPLLSRRRQRPRG